MKMRFVGTRIGRLALSGRDAFELLRASYRRPETLGTLANDQLAIHLVTRLCLSGKGFIDVGAHIGSIVSAVLRHDRSVKLYVFEPEAAKVEHLR